MKNEKILADAKKTAVTDLLRRVSLYLTLAVISAVLASAELFPYTYPLGISFVSALQGLRLTSVSLIGAVFGTLLSGERAFPLLVSFVARIGLSLYLGEGKKHGREIFNALLDENVYLRMITSSAAALACGAWSVAANDFDYYRLFGAVLSVLITPVFTYLFAAAFDKRMKSSTVCEIGAYFTLAAVTYAFHGLGGDLFELGYAAAFFITVTCAKKYGIYRAVSVAVSCGCVLESEMIPPLALAAVMSALFFSRSPLLALSSAVVTSSAYGIFIGGLDGFLSLFPPSTLAAALVCPFVAFGGESAFVVLFGRKIKKASYATADVKVSSEEYRHRVGGIAQSLVTSSALISTVAEKLRKPSLQGIEEMVSTVFSRHCGLCPRRERCPRDGLCEIMVKRIVERGEVGAADVPTKTASTCCNIGKILDEVNSAVALKLNDVGDALMTSAEDMAAVGELLCRMDSSHEREFKENRELSAKLERLLRYNDIVASGVKVLGERHKRVFVGEIEVSSARVGGDDLRRLVGEILGGEFTPPEFALDGNTLSMKLESAVRFEINAGSFGMAANTVDEYCAANGNEEEKPVVTVEDKPSGDTICTFEASGKRYMIISDGMGSGREASVTSGLAVTLLRQYIEGGAELENALELLNGILRRMGRECFTTMDICEIDLYTSEARFIKSGAAPSFVLRNGSIYRLQSKTVPIGIIRAIDAEQIRFEIEDGDTVVMLSDGAARSYEEVPWLLDMMTSDEVVLHGSPENAAMAIVSEAAMRGSKDDITSGIMRVVRNEE